MTGSDLDGDTDYSYLPPQALGTINAERKGMNSGREEEGEERTVCRVLSPSLYLSVLH